MRQEGWRTVRVFISSTFRDMQAERGHLVRFVFPRLREELLPRRIHLVDVDLRWGVTTEQDALEVCREIIDECRPRFICLLGGRYGWVPPGKEHSITADEVRYGVLDRLEVKEYRYFYFRKDEATDSIPEEAARAGGYREFATQEDLQAFGLERANELARSRTRKLEDLKQAVVDAGFEPFVYPARWDAASGRIVGLEAFGDRVYADLLASVDEEFGTEPPEALDEFAEEDAVMGAFLSERVERYVVGSRQSVFDELTQFAQVDREPNIIALTGAPGCGKSALLGRFSQDYARRHPDDLVITHFVGASAGSTDLRRTLRRLCHALTAASGEREIPQEAGDLVLLFAEMLSVAARRQRVVLILDALNQLDAADNAHSMYWLPRDLPPNVRVIASSLEHPALEALRQRRESVREILVKPLTADDGRAIIEGFLRRYRKRMTTEQSDALLAKPESGSPLYLLAALEELRTLDVPRDVKDSKDQDAAVVRAIAGFPDNVRDLFLWILRRLEKDPGFLDRDGNQIGAELVRNFMSLVGVSRHGLSYTELAELIAPENPKSDPAIPADAQGNVAALQRLLRPYLMLRGELFDFYHVQLREAVESECLDEEHERLAAHRQLAEYFRRKAKPEGSQSWELNARQLAELPFHLAHGRQESELLTIFSRLSYLAARVATGQVYEQIGDYSLTGSPLPQALIEWHDFLQKHAQRLAQHPAMFVGLVNHEGFAQARAQVAGIQWRESWLRTSPEQMPPGKTQFTQGVRVEVAGSLESPRGRVAAIAPQRGVGFELERLGVLRVLDTDAMRQTDTVLSIRRERPLVMVCAPDATSLAVLYESGKADLYRCVLEGEERPVRLDVAAEFSFQLPECENPVVEWYDGAYWFQATVGTLARMTVESSSISEQPFPGGETGELSALIFGEGIRLVALRHGRDTSLLGEGTPPLRRMNADVSAACACREQRVAVAFSDGSLVVYESGPVLMPKTEVRAGILRGALGWDGSRLLWVAENRGFFAWRPEEASPLLVQDNQEVFPDDLHVIPRRWFCRHDGTMLLVTTHSVVAFRLLQGGAVAEGRLEELFGGPAWRAVCKRANDQWLIESQPLREVLLGRSVMGRLYCAPDGKGQFFAASSYGPGLVFDLATLQSTPLRGCPPGLNVAVGEPEGGCWLTDRAGDIYFANTEGQCQCMAKTELPDVTGAQLVNGEDHLVWAGYSTKFFPETGADAARTFIFFRKHRGTGLRLERLGAQLRHPREGLCVAICYDSTARRFVMVWAKLQEGVQSYSLRIGSADDLANWGFRETEIVGLGPSTLVQSDLSADAQFLGVVNRAGEFSCLNVADGRVVATLAGSAPFTAVAAGPAGPEFWLVEARSRVYRCSLSRHT